MKFHQNVKPRYTGDPSFLTFAVCQEGAKTEKKLAALSQKDTVKSIVELK